MERLYDAFGRITERGKELSREFEALTREYIDEHPEVDTIDLSMIMLEEVHFASATSRVDKMTKELLAKRDKKSNMVEKAAVK